MDVEISEITGRWDYSQLPANIRIGQGCWLERKQSFERFRSRENPGLVLGDRVRVYTWATFNVESQGKVEVGDDSILVGPIFMCSQSIVLGRNVVISYNVTIADSDFHPLDPRLRLQDAVANSPSGDRSTRPAIVSRRVQIGDGAWIGIGAIILKGVTIGPDARIGPGAVVTRDVAAGAWVEGNPARQVASPGIQT